MEDWTGAKEEQKSYGPFLDKYGNILAPIVAIFLGVLILVGFWWVVKVTAHLYQTGNFIEPAVRIVKTETYEPIEDSKGNLELGFRSEVYEVEYKTLDDGIWMTACYERCYVKDLESAEARARFVTFMIKKFGSPYSEEFPRFNKIEIETIIPYKGEK